MALDRLRACTHQQQSQATVSAVETAQIGLTLVKNEFAVKVDSIDIDGDHISGYRNCVTLLI